MKTINRTIILFFLLIGLFDVDKSQNASYNEAKYWIWRDRLLNDFMVPGYCTGCGIIFNTRGSSWCMGYPPLDTNTTFWTYGGFDIGDEGWEMGEYLIVLASEWRLLYNSGLPTDKTELEIYYELKTIDRLDNDAEKYWTWYWKNKGDPINYYSDGLLDGFMIKDDVFEDFLYYSYNLPINFPPDAFKKYLYLNQDIIPTNVGHDLVGKYQKQNILPYSFDQHQALTLSQFFEISRSTNDDDGYPNNGFSGAVAGLHASDADCPNYTSHPHPINCTGPTEYSKDNYIGLLQGLVAVYKLVYSGANVNGMNLSDYSSQIINRIIHSIRDNSNGNGDNWVIDNPVTQQCEKGTEWNKILDNFQPWYQNGCESSGAWAGVLSGEFARIHNMYTSGNNMSGQIINALGTDQMSCVLATLTGYFPLFDNETDEEVNDKVTKWVDEGPHVAVDLRFKYKYLDLLYCILHYDFPEGDNTSRGYATYEADLNNASCCLWNNEDHKIYDEQQNNYLTQMIIHNLLKLLKGETLTYGNIKDSYHYPGIYIPGSTDCLPYTKQVYGEIQSTATLSSLSNVTNGSDPCFANVTYIAGERILLKPGFMVSNGCKFVAKIQPYDCKIRDGYYDIFNLPYNPTNSNGNKNYDNPNHQDGSNNFDEQSFIISKEQLGNSNINNNSEIEISDEIKIFPNPTKQFVNIQIPENNPIRLEVSNIYSQLLISRMLQNGSTIINLSDYSKGVYFFKLYDKDNLLKFEKIILQ